jgi:hypothetical protein
MAALANMVTQLGALMAANPVATKILSFVLGWLVFDYVCITYGTFPTATVNSAFVPSPPRAPQRGDLGSSEAEPEGSCSDPRRRA